MDESFDKHTFKTGKEWVFILTLALFFMPCGFLNVFAQDNIQEPPEGYDQLKKDISHGITEIVSYYSSTVGEERKNPDLLTTRIYD